MDKVDILNREKAIKSNIVKWWNVNMVEAEVLVGDPVTEASEAISDEALETANEIYERLMAEAAADEAKKQEEIERAKALSEM